MKDLHHAATVVDTHNDLLLLIQRDLSVGNATSLRDEWIPHLKQGGVDVQVLPIYIEDEFVPEASLRRTMQMIGALYSNLAEAPGGAVLCLTGEDIDESIATGKLALILALEGAEAVGIDLSLLRVLHRLGVRMVSFTWNRRTMLADGIAESGTGGRLTTLGVEAVAMMESLGMLVDVTHVSESGTWHILEVATRPLVATHSNCRAILDHPRNLTDEQIRAISSTGGVIGLNVHPALVDPDDPSIDRCVDHLEHMVDVAGEDHVGLGPDFVKDYYDRVHPPVRRTTLVESEILHSTVRDLGYPRDLPNLTEGMVRRGFPEDLIRKILGENFLDVFRRTFTKTS